MGFPDFHEHPGQLFVVATFLPLASFVLLLLIGGLKRFLSARRENATAASLYGALGGDTPTRGGAYVATAAIGLAFVFSALGAFHYYHDEAKYATHGHASAPHDE